MREERREEGYDSQQKIRNGGKKEERYEREGKALFILGVKYF